MSEAIVRHDVEEACRRHGKGVRLLTLQELSSQGYIVILQLPDLPMRLEEHELRPLRDEIEKIPGVSMVSINIETD